MHYLRDTANLYCKRLKDKLKNRSKSLKKKKKERDLFIINLF